MKAYWCSAAILFVATVIAAGCRDSQSELEQPANPDEVAAANTIIDSMITAYRQAETYRDHGSIEWDLHRRGESSRHERYDYALEFARPNRLRLSFDPYGSSPVELVSDGFKVNAAPKYYFNQVVQFDAPEKIEVPAFYEQQALEGLLTPTVVCSLVSGSEPRFGSLPLDLLAGTDPLKELRTADTTPRLVEPQVIGNERCNGVRYNVAQDRITLWVSEKTHILKRVQIVPAKTSSNSQVRERISITFRDAEINAPEVSQRFHWNRSGENIFVHELVSPTGVTESSSALVGQEIPNYEFFRADGTPGDMQSLRGKTTVIDLWATYCPPCAMALPKLSEVRQMYADDDRVQFLALSADAPDDTTLQEVQAKLAEWQADVPFAQLAGTDISTIYEQLHLQGIPATIILSPSGAIQFAEVGYRPNMTTTLPKLIDSLLSYDERIEAARIDDGSQSVPLPQLSIAEANQPKNWKLTRAWSNGQIENPGNVLVIQEAEQASRILVIEGPRSVVELDAHGKIIKRHEDIVPEGASISVVRTATTKAGERLFVTAGVGNSQIFAFNEDWTLRFAYPKEPGVGKVYDVTVGRFSKDGGLNILAGYFGPAGVHALSADGERHWRNRFVENVGDMAVVPATADRPGAVLCVNQLGTLLPINEQGEMQSPWRYRDRAVPFVSASPQLDDSPIGKNVCVITVDVYGNRVAAGLDDRGGVKWSYVLPPGEYQNIIDPFAYARLGEDNREYWIIAAANGTVHWIREDGQKDDHFATGGQLSGIATTTIGDQPVLLLSGSQGVTAWAMEPASPTE